MSSVTMNSPNPRGKIELFELKYEYLEWYRNKVLELSSQGHNQLEISRTLQISQPS